MAPTSLAGLALVLGLTALTAAALGMFLVFQSAPDDAQRSIGGWLLQLALVFAGTGVVSIVVRHYELTRAQREAWLESLHELVGAHDEVQMAARLLSAHATAKTYGEQVMVLIRARATLRRLSSAPGVRDDETLHDSLVTMRKYLKYVVREYEAQYLPVARQQRLDEAALTHRFRKIAEASSGAFPLIPPELAQPLPAGAALQDRDRFPLLNEFRTDFKESAFRGAYSVAKPIMARQAGLPMDAPPSPRA